MPIHEGQYHVSNSEYNDWQEMCPLVWKAKCIDKLPELWKESEDVDARDWGVEFETLVIGSGVGGRMVPEAKRAKMKKSDYYDRIKQQAADCRSYLKLLGGKICSRQKYVYTSVKDATGQEVLICGGWDIEYQLPDGEKMIIDLKMPGDNENDFGKYQFGNVDKIVPTQAIHYKLLHKCLYGTDAAFQYWVFDKTKSVNQKIIRVNASEIATLLHIEKLSQVYNEIIFAMQMDDWGYVNTYENCRNCPTKCKYERVMPDIIDLDV